MKKSTTDIEKIVNGFLHSENQRRIFEVFRERVENYDILTDGINLAMYAGAVAAMQDVSARLDSCVETKEQKRLADLYSVHQARALRSATALGLGKKEQGKSLDRLKEFLGRPRKTRAHEELEDEADDA